MKSRLHTAEHILYTVLKNQYEITSKALEFKKGSFRVVYECITDIRNLAQKLQDEVNAEIEKGYNVINYILPRIGAEKIADVSLIPESVSNISIYEIEGFNRLACAGPHVKNTKEIGTFTITKIQKKGQNIYSISCMIT
ncbi:MAG: hypothetical protein WCW16_02715 [Candidatus Magasanikbacteria bacterium]